MALTKASQGQVAATEWRFEESALGKPYIAADLPQIQFSISHNDVASVVAISRTAVVGVDIEHLDQEINGSLIDFFCSGHERIQLRRMSKAERSLAFLKLWTLKEAYSKIINTVCCRISALSSSGLGSRCASVGDPNFALQNHRSELSVVRLVGSRSPGCRWA